MMFDDAKENSQAIGFARTKLIYFELLVLYPQVFKNPTWPLRTTVKLQKPNLLEQGNAQPRG